MPGRLRAVSDGVGQVNDIATLESGDSQGLR
jgi:hypothetical protein